MMMTNLIARFGALLEDCIPIVGRVAFARQSTLGTVVFSISTGWENEVVGGKLVSMTGLDGCLPIIINRQYFLKNGQTDTK